MTFLTLICVVTFGSFLVGCAMTYLVRSASRRIGFVDKPDGVRKIHDKPVALGGGIAIFATICLVVLGGFWIIPNERIGDQSTTFALLQFSLILLFTGLIDDSRGMPGKYKLLLQVVAALVVAGSGTGPSVVAVFGYEMPLGILGTAFAVLWIIGAINSFNLLDGVDGLAASVGIVLALTIGAVALLIGHSVMGLMAFVSAGAIGGFLFFNRAPATIYLGDTGSMFIGGILGVIALRCATKEAAAVAFAAPLAIWAIPIFDSVSAIIRRKLTGRSMYATDRGHIHHQLLVRGLSPNKAVLAIAGMCVVIGLAAIAGVYWQLSFLGPIAAAGTITFLVASRVFGHSEAALLNHRLVTLGRRILPGAKFVESGNGSSVRFQGSFQWDFFWLPLIESAARFNLAKIRLNVHLPHCHEDFYSQWASQESLREAEGWKLRLPLHCGGETIGKLEIHGHDSEDAAARMSEFVEFFQSLESELYLAINRDVLPPQERPTQLPASESIPEEVAEPQS
jgi:UDP-GlcNAc:undecaprenyl-phosphate GlcNAc-1-phosphate transferase